MSLYALLRADFNDFLDTDEIALCDLGDLALFNTRVNYSNPWCYNSVHVGRATSNAASKYRLTGDKLVKRSKVSVMMPEPVVTGDVQSDLAIVRESGYGILPVDEAIQILRSDNDAVLNWHRYGESDIRRALRQGKIKLAYGMIYFTDYETIDSITFGEMTRRRGSRGVTEQFIRDVYSRYGGDKNCQLEGDKNCHIPCFL